MNNSWSATTNKISNEAALDFTPATELDLFKFLADRVNPTETRLDVANSITLAQINSQFHYDTKHQPISLVVRDYILLQLHTGSSIPFALNRKLDQQYVGPIQVIEKVKLLADQLDIPKEWQIHLVFSITQLEPCLPLYSDPFARPRLYNPDSIYIKRDTDLV